MDGIASERNLPFGWSLLARSPQGRATTQSYVEEVGSLAPLSGVGERLNFDTNPRVLQPGYNLIHEKKKDCDGGALRASTTGILRRSLLGSTRVVRLSANWKTRCIRLW
jgi:hypothetical protein